MRAGNSLQSLLRCSSVLLLALLALGTRLPQAESANILGVFTSHSPSHLIVHMSVMKALAEQGHNITVVSSMQPKVSHKSIKHIVIPLNDEEMKAIDDGISVIAKQKPSIITTLRSMFSSLNLLIAKQVDVLEDARFTQLYNKANKFDLVFIGFFFNLYQVGLAAKFNCPIIVDWSGPPMEVTDVIAGNPRLEATVPNMHVPVKMGETMSFKQRAINYFSTVTFRLFGFFMDIRFEAYYRRLFGEDKTMPSYEEAKKNVSLVFCNSHSLSEGPIRPNVPAVIEIGGIQVKEQPAPLPQDIEQFMSEAKHGVILFSLGSNLKGEHIQSATLTHIFNTLASLKQRVIWKWDDMKLTPGTAANIVYKKWLPQDDILAHPNLKLFITHAGKGGVAEAQYHGVPMLALPVFADQPGNADKLVDSGYGLRVDLLDLDPAVFKAAIVELLNNPAYKTKLQQFSKLYRDRPMTARQTVVYWTEYVLRHHGAAHMQSPLVHMSFVASNNLDVYALLAVILYVCYLVTKLILKFVFKKCCGSSKKVAPKKKAKKQ